MLIRAIFDNWQVSGVTTFTTGTYGNLTYSVQQRADGCRSSRQRRQSGRSRAGSSSRAIRICRRGERTFDRQFRRRIGPARRRTNKFHLEKPGCNDEYLGPDAGLGPDISVSRTYPR